ncbi:hypothetical protein [Glutamicibacter sp. TV12E]|uniref:hypothetical protein n=1 Tax=Glutamicibacter sp. TV12E TaxID=3446362 RepID=UPI004034C26D
MAINRTDHTIISMGEWSISRRVGTTDAKFDGKAIGLWLNGTGDELEGDDFLTREEALELRDYIDKHLGGTDA